MKYLNIYCLPPKKKVYGYPDASAKKMKVFTQVGPQGVTGSKASREGPVSRKVTVLVCCVVYFTDLYAHKSVVYLISWY